MESTSNKVEAIKIGLYSPSMQMGKTTTATYLREQFGFKPIILSKTFKKMLEILLADLGIKKSLIKRYIYGDLKETIIPELGVSSRHAMQTIGSDWGRNCINKDIWLKCGAKKIVKEFNYVCEDVRRLNEAEFFKDKGFKLVKIVNPRVEIVRNHESEGELDEYQFDYTIINDGTIEELHEKIEDMIISFCDFNF